jgi:tetratricopeptide (TPR) repeat protein
MSSHSERLQSAVQLHLAGKLDQARKVYEQVLADEPNNANALNLLGLASWQTGQHARAAELLHKAIAIDASQSAFYANLAAAQRGLGQFDEAMENYDRAIRLQPYAAVVHVHLGDLYEQLQEPEKAIASYERAVQVEPNRCEPYARLALVYKQRGDLRRAADFFHQAIQRAPAMAELYFELANVLQMANRLDDAIECYRKAIQLKPDYPEADCNLGNALRERGQWPEARELLERAVARRPQFAAPISNLGAVLQDLGQLDESRKCFERAFELEPGRPEVLMNMGTILKDFGQAEQALTWYERALAAQPGYPQALCSRGTARLSLGRFAEGWADYEHRVKCPQYNTLRLPGPRWDGSPLGERRLLVHGEQGFGDQMQFIRYLPRVRALGEHVTLLVDEPLVPLFEQSGFAPVAPKVLPLPPFDVHVPMMSLPHVFGTTVDTVPAEVPYLAADPTRIQRWRDELQKYPAFRVGIAWQGRPTFRGDPLRSIPLACFEPLARVEGVRLISLQKVHGTEQLAEVADRFEVIDLAASLDVSGGAFLDIAAVMKSLDLVICCDTAVAHLAGALGVRVWVALIHAPDWRWMIGRDDSPWYPTMRLFRQSEPRQWSDVFDRMAAELRAVKN